MSSVIHLVSPSILSSHKTSRGEEIEARVGDRTTCSSSPRAPLGSSSLQNAVSRHTRTPPFTIAERRFLHATVQRVPDELNTLHARPNKESTSLMTPFAESIAYVARKAGEERACVV